MSSEGLVKVFTWLNSFMDPCRDLKLGWADTGMIKLLPDVTVGAAYANPELRAAHNPVWFN